MSTTRPEIKLECDLSEGLKGHACGDCPILMKGKMTQGFELKSYIMNVTGGRYEGLILYIIPERCKREIRVEFLIDEEVTECLLKKK